MFNIDKIIINIFVNLLSSIISTFSDLFNNIASSALNFLNFDIISKTVEYAQILAFSLLTLKVINEAIQTYILHQNGDPDADPTGLLIRTSQAYAVIAFLPWIIRYLFNFSTKVSNDLASINAKFGGNGNFLTDLPGYELASFGFAIVLVLLLCVIFIVVVLIQSSIRGAELALMSIIGPVMALNITANNRNIWSAWFKQLIIICMAQALQIFMLKAGLYILVDTIVDGKNMLMLFGWLWVTIKTPKFLQQFAYSTGFTGSVGGTAKQAGTFYVMRKMMAR